MRILLVRLRLIGDVVFTTPAIGALRRRFPDAHLTYLVEAPAEPVVTHHPDLNAIIVLERPRGLARLRYDLQLASRLRAERFDVAIDFHGGPRSGFLTWATGARQRIGYDLPGRGWCYTTRIPWTRSLVPPRHSVLNQWDLLTPLGIEAADRVRDPVTMTIDPAADARVQSRLAAAGVAPGAPLDRDARQRRQPVPPLARGIVCRGGGGTGARGPAAPRDRDIRSVRSRRRRSRRPAGTVARR